MARMGRIFNIQRFSIHDGPGIRTIVFFKGCYMRCVWCCNPESQEFAVQTMVENGKSKTVGRDVSVEEIMPELLADEHYYRRSGGGITLSGGEFLGQHEFAAELLKACKEYGLHTAVESTANAPWEKIEAVLPYIDLYLMDIKLMDSESTRRIRARAMSEFWKTHAAWQKAVSSWSFAPPSFLA